MALTPEEGYHNSRSRPWCSAETASSLLVALGDAELPDANPTNARKQELKALAREIKVRLSPRERVYIASYLEDDALREWATAEARRA